MGLVGFCCRHCMSWCSRGYWLTKLESRSSWCSLVLSGKGLTSGPVPVLPSQTGAGQPGAPGQPQPQALDTPGMGTRWGSARTWAHKWARLGRDVGSWRLTLLWPCCGPGADMESWARGRWGEPQRLDRVSQSWWWPQRPQKRSRSYRRSKSPLQDIFLKILMDSCLGLHMPHRLVLLRFRPTVSRNEIHIDL